MKTKHQKLEERNLRALKEIYNNPDEYLYQIIPRKLIKKHYTFYVILKEMNQ